MSYNKKFKIVFQPKEREKYNGRRRFFIGANSLYKYVGRKSAKNALEKAETCLEDKFRRVLRGRGTIDFYYK